MPSMVMFFAEKRERLPSMCRTLLAVFIMTDGVSIVHTDRVVGRLQFRMSVAPLEFLHRHPGTANDICNSTGGASRGLRRSGFAVPPQYSPPGRPTALGNSTGTDRGQGKLLPCWGRGSGLILLFPSAFLCCGCGGSGYKGVLRQGNATNSATTKMLLYNWRSM